MFNPSKDNYALCLGINYSASINVHPDEVLRTPSVSLYTVKAVCKLPSHSWAGTVMTFNSFIIQTVWLTQDQMKTLFQRDKSVISRHIRDIFNEGELDPEVVVAKNATTTRHGAIADKTQTHEKLVYNLDVIISVGYCVKSKRGTQFRIWATSVLKEYLIKGYAVRSRDLHKQSSQSLDFEGIRLFSKDLRFQKEVVYLQKKLKRFYGFVLRGEPRLPTAFYCDITVGRHLFHRHRVPVFPYERTCHLSALEPY